MLQSARSPVCPVPNSKSSGAPTNRPGHFANTADLLPAAPHDVSRTRWSGGSIHPQAESKVRPGELLAGRFEIRHLLGRGGMAEVFLAHDMILDEDVAVKIVPTDDSEMMRSRLRREVLLARKATHNNVCRIYDLSQHWDGERGRFLDLVSMELLIGETLRDRRARQGRLDLAEALPIVRQIARGLSAAHRHGIVHRDLKPSNVMLVEEPQGLRAAITDFGLARRIGAGGPDPAVPKTTDLTGTPAYMAPEQINNEPLSPATDIYSLGLILYELLAGRLPFSGNTPWEIAAARVTHAPMPIEQYVPGLAAEIVALIDGCLERDPSRRFSSTSEILERLDFGDGSWEVYGRKTHRAETRP